jgi:hypothetical protein
LAALPQRTLVRHLKDVQITEVTRTHSMHLGATSLAFVAPEDTTRKELVLLLLIH